MRMSTEGRPVRPEPSACEWLRRLDARELTSKELANYYLDRIERANPSINAVVALNPDRTLLDASKADAARARGEGGALLGLPVTIKDSIEVEGFTCAAGSVFRSECRPERDATVAARVRNAGGIVLGKTNVPEYISSFETDNVVYGRTNNPLDLSRTPGGSSGGEAAILAAEASPLGLGSDGGGSIRVPAHYCGITGIRPTVGVIPETGAWPPSRSTGSMDIHTIGPMGRFVEDLALLLLVTAGPDWQDPFCVPVAFADWRDIEVAGLRVGFYVDDPVATPTAETGAAVRLAAGALEAMGSNVTEVLAPPCVCEATELFFACAGADGGAKMRADVAAADGRHHPNFGRSWLRGSSNLRRALKCSSQRSVVSTRSEPSYGHSSATTTRCFAPWRQAQLHHMAHPRAQCHRRSIFDTKHSTTPTPTVWRDCPQRLLLLAATSKGSQSASRLSRVLTRSRWR